MALHGWSWLLLLSATAGGCTWFKDNPHVLITSEPPGAAIALDGNDTGQTTPASFEIAANFGHDHVVTLTKKGYRPETRQLVQRTEGYTSKWIDGASGGEMSLPPLPIFWTGGDFFFPFGVRGALIPNEIYVKLYREDEPRLGRDALANRPGSGAEGPDDGRP